MCYLSNVVIDQDVGVVVAEDAARAWLNLTAEDDLVASVGEAKVSASAS